MLDSMSVPDQLVNELVTRELLRLARAEESHADTEAAKVPYWAPFPDSVVAHRAAARVLREDAARMCGRTSAPLDRGYLS
jgi:hypothetical protein